eukprot:575909-Rhodomonas_salina.4
MRVVCCSLCPPLATTALPLPPLHCPVGLRGCPRCLHVFLRWRARRLFPLASPLRPRQLLQRPQMVDARLVARVRCSLPLSLHIFVSFGRVRQVLSKEPGGAMRHSGDLYVHSEATVRQVEVQTLVAVGGHLRCILPRPAGPRVNEVR